MVVEQILIVSKALIIKNGGRMGECRKDGFLCFYKLLQIIVSVSKEKDNMTWIHISLTRTDKKQLPTYNDMKDVKSALGFDTEYAYQVFPPQNNHVNIHKYVLHLWICADKYQYLPDFTRGSNSI